MPIQLPALGIQAPQQTDILGQAAKLRQFQAMGQEQQIHQQTLQSNALDLQMKQRDMQDQQTVMSVLQKHNGDLHAALPELSGTIAAKNFLPLDKYDRERTKESLELDEKTRNAKIAVNGDKLGLIEQAQQLAAKDPQAYAQAYPQIAQQMIALDPSYKKSIDPNNPVPPEMLDRFKIGLMTDSVYEAKVKAQREQTEEDRKAALAPSQLAKSQADATIAQGEAAAMQGGGVNPKIPLEVQEANSWMKEHPGRSLADYQKYKATLVPAFNFNLQNATGAGGGGAGSGGAADIAKRFGYTPTAFDQAAEKYWSSGQLPPAGRGGPALAANKAIQNRAAELHPDGSLAANSAEYKANSDSLKKIQTNFDQVTAFENTAGKNLDVFLKTAQKVVDSGSPWINKPLRMVSSGGLGSEDQAAFNAARQTAVTEIAKVLNSSNASGVLSDSARHEVEGLIGPNASLRQIVSAANVLKQDMANRHQAYQDQIGDIKGRMGGKQQPQSTPPAAPTSSGGFSVKAPNNKTYSFKDQKSLDDFKKAAGIQ